MHMLLLAPPVPTAASASVTHNRFDLERKCELVEKKILRTVNKAQILIANLGALLDAIDKYLELLEELRNDILFLAKLAELLQVLLKDGGVVAALATSD